MAVEMKMKGKLYDEGRGDTEDAEEKEEEEEDDDDEDADFSRMEKVANAAVSWSKKRKPDHVEYLGGGGFGSVWNVKIDGRPFALKKMTLGRTTKTSVVFDLKHLRVALSEVILGQYIYYKIESPYLLGVQRSFFLGDQAILLMPL